VCHGLPSAITDFVVVNVLTPLKNLHSLHLTVTIVSC